MSLSPSIGVVGPSHWAYGAAVMNDRLGKLINEKRVNNGLIPKGVYLGIKRFFDLVLNQGGCQVPSASISNGLIAANALARSSDKAPYDLSQFDEIMKEYSRFVNSLESERDLSPDELQIAEQVRRFFKQIEQDGDNERYEKAVKFGSSARITS